MTDAGIAAERPAGSAPTEARETLTRRASRTALVSFLDFGSRVGITFLITPVLLSGLGRTLYGVWELLNRLVSHLVAADGRPTEALRLIVASQQDTADDETQRRHVGGALAVWLLFLPIVGGIGAVLIWITPRLVKATPALVGPVRLACALLVGGTMLATLRAIPESVLRGMNRGYEGMGFQIGINVVSGVLMVAAIWAGLGLTGLAAAQMIVIALGGLMFLVLARHYVAWFGLRRPRRAEIRSLFGLSAWISVGDTVSRLLAAADVVILGFLLSPAVVTTYVLTGNAAKFAVGVVTLGVGSAMPGFGGLLGRGDVERATRSSREIVATAWLLMTAAGATILAWNPSLLDLWVGPGQGADMLVTLLIVLMAVETVVIRTYVFMIDAGLRTRFRVLVGAASAIAAVGGAIAGTLWLGLPGLCLGVLIGRGGPCLVYPWYVRRHLVGRARPPSLLSVARAGAVTVLAYLGGVLLGERIAVDHWIAWIAGAGLTFGVALIGSYLAGLPAPVRLALRHRVTRIVAKHLR